MSLVYSKMFKLLFVIFALALIGGNAEHSISKRSVDELRDNEVLIIKQALRYVNGDSTIINDLQILADYGADLVEEYADKKQCAAEVHAKLLIAGASFIEIFFSCVGRGFAEVNTNIYALWEEKIANDEIPKLAECIEDSMIKCLSAYLDGMEAAHSKLLELLGQVGLAIIVLMDHITKCNVQTLLEGGATVAIFVAEAHNCLDPPPTP